MRLIVILIAVIFTRPSWSTVTAGADDCPVQFEGKIREIIEPVGSQDVFSTSKVVFDNLRTLKGEVSEKVLVDVLTNGPFQLEIDKEFKVQLRNGKLCWIEEI